MVTRTTTYKIVVVCGDPVVSDWTPTPNLPVFSRIVDMRVRADGTVVLCHGCDTSAVEMCMFTTAAARLAWVVLVVCCAIK